MHALMFHRAPNYERQVRFTIQGAVIAQGTKTTGFIFKKKWNTVTIRLDREQLEAAYRQFRSFPAAWDNAPNGSIAPVVMGHWPVDQKKAEELPIGSTVNVTFGYFSPIDQFFDGAPILQVLEIVRVEPAAAIVEVIG